MHPTTDLNYIRIPYPDAKDLQFKIFAPVCIITISPGIGNAWATGKYVDLKEVAPLAIHQSENMVNLTATGPLAYRVSPNFYPSLKLSFGRVRPFSLSLAAGNVSSRFDFGGLPLSSLTLEYGAAGQVIDFSYAIPKPMNDMTVSGDDCLIKIENISNANAANVQLKGESCRYRLNFGGALKQNMNLHLGVGLTRVGLNIPSGTAVKIRSGVAPTCTPPDPFSCADHTYWNAEARDHQEPLLSITNVAACPIKIQFV